MLDNCNLFQIGTCQDICDLKSSGDVFDIMTGGEVDISSDPLQVCSCDKQYKSNCSLSPIVRVYPGKTFSVHVVAFGQRHGVVPTVILSKLSNNISIPDLQFAQQTTNIQPCSVLNFTIMSLIEHPQKGNWIQLYAEGPCTRDGNSLIIQVEMLGFELSNISKVCECHKRLETFTDICNIDTGTILRRSGVEFWVGYDNDYSGLILHPHCPFTGDERYIDVDNSDAHNRSGVLCGECSQNLSLLLGSSRCMHCSNTVNHIHFCWNCFGSPSVYLEAYGCRWNSSWIDLLCKHCASKFSRFPSARKCQPINCIYCLVEPGLGN